MADKPKQIAIIGAGVIGLSVAVQLTERFPNESIVVTLISEAFSPHTTSDKAGCIIIPFDVRSPGTPDNPLYKNNVKKWTKQTFEHLHTLYTSRHAGDINLQMVHGYCGDQSTSTGDPWWAELTNGFRHVDIKELQQQRLPLHYKNMYSFGTYILACVGYLPWLMKRFKDKGGLIEQRKIHTLNELNSYDIIINCTGLGSHGLANDTSVYPVRGDTVTVKAPWIKQFIILQDHSNLTYIFPRAHDVLLGGTKKTHDWSNEKDDSASREILSRCTNLIPSIHNCDVINESWGLRPARDSVRLELVARPVGEPPVIHCYGHGGQGIVLHWGCALDVVELVANTLFFKQKSKL